VCACPKWHTPDIIRRPRPTAILDLERVVPAVEGGRVIEATGPDSVKAETTPAAVTFRLNDGGGDIHTHAQITGKAASMGEGVVVGVLDGLITDFMGKLGQI